MHNELGETLLKIDDVSLSFDGRPILKGVNAEIRRNITETNHGQIVGILGPSGIGKTQLFRIISGLNKPSSGRVSIYGKDEPVRAGEIGVVAQSYPLFEHRSVLSNLMISAVQKEADNAKARENVLYYLNEFDLLDKAHLFPAQLSGGQRQRIAIIQQILCSEHILLMDEPFSGLDLLMLDRTCQLLMQIAKLDSKNTIIVVTHDVTTAASIADHLWLIGRDSDAQGNKLPGSRIVKEINLIERDLCWQPDLTRQPRFLDFVREVKDQFRQL